MFGLGPERGRGVLAWGGERGKCSVPSTFGVGKGQTAQLGASGKEFLNTCYLKTCGFALRHPEAPASSAGCEFVHQQISRLSKATGTPTEILNKQCSVTMERNYAVFFILSLQHHRESRAAQ